MAKRDEVTEFLTSLQRPRKRCKICSLPPETLDDVRRLRATQLDGAPVSWARIAEFLRSRRSVVVDPGTIKAHLKLCEASRG